MDVEHVAVAPTVGGDSRYKKFDYQKIGKINEEELESHGVDTEAAQSEASKAHYVGPEIISDPLSSSMATYRWKNASDPHIHDYASLYHLKHCWQKDLMKQ